MTDSEAVRLSFDGFELDQANASLIREGRVLALPPRAFDVLCALARQPGRLLTKNELLDAVWGHRHVSESVLKGTISELRAALGDDARNPRYVETAARRGYRFVWAMQAGDTKPGGGAEVVDGPSWHLIGRAESLARLRRCWQNALDGRRQLVWIAGEPGVGKTTLIESFLRELAPDAWVLGQCVEHSGASEPYMPVLEALSSACRRDAALVGRLRDLAPTWLLQLPGHCSDEVRDALRIRLANAGTERMVREFKALLDSYTLERPLVLVTEDLHWSDEATLHLMDHFSRGRHPARMLWLGSFRLAEVMATDHPLKALRHELRLHQLCEELLLDPFSEQEVSAYLADRLPATHPSDDFVRRLHAHTDGLPLFVANVISDLLLEGEQGAAAIAGTVSHTELGVPESLAGVIERQATRLTADQRQLLGAASVCGMEFRARTLADVLGREEPWALQVCEELVQGRHWIAMQALGRLPDGALDARYVFRHALYRHVFHQQLGAVTRAQMHQRAAQSLERARDLGWAISAAELAAHYEAGHDLVAALRLYGDAAESALNHFVPAEAVRITGHALSLLARVAPGIERNELELALQGRRGVACSQAQGAGSEAAAAAFARARELADQLPAARLRAFELGGVGVVHYVRGEYDKALAVASHLRMLAETRDDPILHMAGSNLLGSVLSYQGELQPAVQLMQQALVQCRASEEALRAVPFVVNPLVAVCAHMSLPLLYLGRVDQARQQVAEACVQARRVGQPMALMVSAWFAAQVEARLGCIGQVPAHIETIQSAVTVQGLQQGAGPALWLRGLVMARSGEAAAGRALILQGYERHRQFGLCAGCTQVLGYAAEAALLSGDTELAGRDIDAALELADRIGERVFVPDLLLTRARIALAAGNRAAARGQLIAALRHACARGAWWQQLDAGVALCELPDAEPSDRAALAAVLAQIREGEGVPLLARARAFSAQA